MNGAQKKSEKAFSSRAKSAKSAKLMWIVNFILTIFVFGTAAGFCVAQINNTEKVRDLSATPEKLSASFAQVSKKVEPAVVNIDTKGKIPAITSKGVKPPEDADDIMEFFRRQMPQGPTSAVGSGFIVDKRGYILTNYHVVEEASRVLVRLPSGEEFAGKIIGADQETDLAVLKIETGRDLPFIGFGNSDNTQVGDWVLAIGSPFGLAQTVTAGIISQTRRETPYSGLFQKFIQTDAAINRGNSGGPLVNMDGEVIGINSQIATSTGASNGIGFALPSNEALNVYNQIVQNGKVKRGYLGAFLDSVKAEFAKVYELPEARGAIVTDVRDPQSAAGSAGLKAGDVILEFNGEKVLGAPDLIQKIAQTEPFKEVNLIYMRDNGARMERKTTVVKIGERPAKPINVGDEPERKLTVGDQKKLTEPFGLTLGEITPQIVALYKLETKKGIVVKNINPASFIADVKNSSGTSAALNQGDLIQRINRVPVTDLKTFNEAAAKLKKGDAVVLQIQNYDFQNGIQHRIVQFTVQ